jgi:hypothetical protein
MNGVLINNGSGPEFAVVFNVTNESTEALIIDETRLSTRLHGNWSRQGVWHPSISLLPHSTSSFTMTISTNSDAWQVSARWRYQHTYQYEYARGIVFGNIVWNWNNLMNGQNINFTVMPATYTPRALHLSQTNEQPAGSRCEISLFHNFLPG